VAGLLAAWMHWYGRMPLQEALLSAEIALGCQVEQGAVEAATEALVAAAEERANRVSVQCTQGARIACAAGELVGGPLWVEHACHLLSVHGEVVALYVDT
jgi:hypothetical protein